MSIHRGLKIAIDGPAGSGKSTVAREVARRLNLTYLDTGAMYRAMTLKLLREKVDLSHIDRVLAVLERTEILPGPDERIYLDGEDVTAEIRTPQVNAAVSRVAELTPVRRKLVQQRRESPPPRRASLWRGGIFLPGLCPTPILNFILMPT